MVGVDEEERGEFEYELSDSPNIFSHLDCRLLSLSEYGIEIDLG